MFSCIGNINVIIRSKWIGSSKYR